MPNWNEGIDGNHLRIAAHGGCAMRVLAGPGTGKSFALQRKVMRLLEEGTNPDKILAVTFTNVAADALKKDLAALEVPGADSVRARTLHSLCFEILRRQHVLEITGRVPRPLMDFERDFLLEDLKPEFGGKRRAEELLQAYESAFARQQHDAPGVVQTTEDLRFKTRLLDWLKFHRAILIGELVPLTYEYLANNPQTPERTQYDFILVDEYQDLNKAEQSLVDLLAGDAELLVVGDDDQSIYSFKHAHPAGIVEFPTTHAPLEDVSLQICRRCPKKVVRLANELMGYLLDTGHPKTLQEFPTNEEGEVFATQWMSIDEETKGVAKIIKKMVSDEAYHIRPEDILVLSPRRKLGYALRDMLQSEYGISSHTYFQEEALDTPKAHKAYSLLNYLVDPDDRVALRVLIGLPTPLTGTYLKLIAKAQELNVSPKDLLIALRDGRQTVSRSDPFVQRFQEIENIKDGLSGQTPEVVLRTVLDPNNPENIEVLLSILNTIEIDAETELRSIFTKLQERIRSPEVTNDVDFIRIMSLHKSKGLTSKVVFRASTRS